MSHVEHAHYEIELTNATHSFPKRTYGLPERFWLPIGGHGKLVARAKRMAAEAKRLGSVKEGVDWCIYVKVDTTGAGIWEPTDLMSEGAEVGEWTGAVYDVDHVCAEDEVAA